MTNTVLPLNILILIQTHLALVLVDSADSVMHLDLGQVQEWVEICSKNCLVHLRELLAGVDEVGDLKVFEVVTLKPL
jgi:hypothetical protein